MNYPELPFVKHRWPLTQHGSLLIDEVVIRTLLSAAAAFEGEVTYAPNLNELLAKSAVLTKNVRNGVPSPWRDYQQLLPELGLMYSTRSQRELTLTNMGRLFLSGEMLFQELLDFQSMRMQYPNGFKSIDNLASEGLKTAQSTLRVKPGVFILKALIELQVSGEACTLSVDECQEFLLPMVSIDDLGTAINLLKERRSQKGLPQLAATAHARRNVQDWFKLLGATSFFELEQSTLTLASVSMNKIETLSRFCDEQSRNSNFWVFDETDGVVESDSWFDFFGNLYVGEVSIHFDQTTENGGSAPLPGRESVDAIQDHTEIVLRELEDRNFEKAALQIDELVKRGVPDWGQIEGLIRQREATILHEKIVEELAWHLREAGAKVFEDLNSVDLFAEWSDTAGHTTVIEVKTVTPDKLATRVRLGIGQLLDYRFKIQRQFGFEPELVLAINIELDAENYYVKLLKHLNIGLICVSNGFSIYPNSIGGSPQWAKSFPVPQQGFEP